MWVVVAVMPEVPLSVLKEKSLVVPVLPLTKILKGVAASPVLINWAVTPRAALLMAATTPAGVATDTAMDLAGAPCTANDNAKAAPPFRAVAAVAKPALMLRWGAASAETDTEWLPVAGWRDPMDKILPSITLGALYAALRPLRPAARLAGS